MFLKRKKLAARTAVPGTTYPTRVVSDGASNYWRLGETAGTTAVDSIGGVNGTIAGGVTLNQTSAISGGNASMLFDGTSGKITTSGNVSIPVACTIEAWIKVSTLAQQRPIISIGIAQTPSIYLITSGLVSYIDSTNAPGATAGTRVMTDGAWHYIACVLNGSTLVFYSDGTLDVSRAFIRSIPDTDIVSIGRDAAFGAVDVRGYWPGSIDEVAIYPRALSSTEVAAHYALR